MTSGLGSTEDQLRSSQTPVTQKDDPMTLQTLTTRLRASLGFNGFKEGRSVHGDQADIRGLQAQIAHISSTLPPKRLRDAEAKAKRDLDKAQCAIRAWELRHQAELSKAESEIAHSPGPRPIRGWN